MELLAPAGTIESFFAALENGADAFYVGLKAFSARAYAHNFTLTELSSLRAITRQQGRKLYVALNALVKEREREELLDTLAGLNEIGPDALIIQDLGVYYVVRQHFPRLPLHASTLMTIHNSLGVQQAASMGFKRVVLARELTLQELATIRRQARIELEVFVHGALCFSFSGLCLFSSYLGGRAATRGQCTQPCRRAYRYDQQSGYILSVSDLAALNLLPQLAALGIDAVKIEGRMKSGDYVGRVVRAYRRLLDASPGERLAAQAEAQELLARTYTRRTTNGFFLLPGPQPLVAPEDTGNIGICLGMVHRVEAGRAVLTLQHEVAVGDRLRVQSATSGERRAITLKDLRRQQQQVRQAGAGEEVQISLPFPGKAGDLVYKVGETTPAGSRSPRKWREYLFRLAPPTFTASKKSPKALQMLKKPPFHKNDPGSQKRPHLYLRVRSLQEAMLLARQVRGRFILDLDETSFDDYLARPRRRRLPARLIWRLPPIMVENQLPRYRQALSILLDAGFSHFFISNLGHLPLLADRGVTLYSDYPLHCLNSWAFQALAALGVKTITLSVESDRETMRSILDRVAIRRSACYLFAYLPLLVSRVPMEGQKKSWRLESPRQEQFRLVRENVLTVLYPTVPFFLGKAFQELKARGVPHFWVDLARSGYPTAAVPELLRQLHPGRAPEIGTAMNYYRGLK